MFRTNILLDLFLPFRTFNKTADIQMQWTTTSAQILNSHENKTKWQVAMHLLKQTADCTALQSQIEPLSQKSHIAKEYGLLPADAQQQ